jgi:hypothetical protein
MAATPREDQSISYMLVFDLSRAGTSSRLGLAPHDGAKVGTTDAVAEIRIGSCLLAPFPVRRRCVVAQTTEDLPPEEVGDQHVVAGAPACRLVPKSSSRIRPSDREQVS